MRKKIYVAGSYNADNVISVLNNMRRGIRVCTKLMLAGHAPFCPWLDYHFQLMLRGNEELAISDYYEYSIAWLSVADCIYVMPNSDTSRGTTLELEYARENEIEIVTDMYQLIERGTG